jgi:hypothetical protein
MEVARGGTSPLDLTGGRGRGTVSPLDRPLSVGAGTGTGARYSSLEAQTINIQAHEVKITANTATLTGAAADRESTAGTGVAPHRDAGGGRDGEPPEGGSDGGDSGDGSEARKARDKKIKRGFFGASLGFQVIKTGFDLYDYSQRSAYQDAELDIYRKFSNLNQDARRAQLRGSLFAEASRGSVASLYAASQIPGGYGTLAGVKSAYGMEVAEQKKLEAQQKMATGKMFSSPFSAAAIGTVAAGAAYVGLGALEIGSGGFATPLVIGGVAAVSAWAGGSYLSAKGQKEKVQADIASGAANASAMANVVKALNLEKEKHPELYQAIESYGANVQSTLNTERALARVGYTNPIAQIAGLGLEFGVSRSASIGMAMDLASNRIVNVQDSRKLLGDMFGLTRGGYSQQSIGAAENLARYTGHSEGVLHSAKTMMDVAASVNNDQLMQEKIVEATANFGPINRTGVVSYHGVYNMMSMMGAAGPGPINLQLGQIGMQGFAQSGQGDFQRMAKVEKLKSRFGKLTGEQLMYLSTLSPTELADYGNLAKVLGVDTATAWDISNYSKGLDADTSIRLALGPKSTALKAMKGKTVAEAYPTLKPEQQLEVQRAATYYGIVSGGLDSADAALKMLGAKPTAQSKQAKTGEAGSQEAAATAMRSIAADVFGFSLAQQALSNLSTTLSTTVANIQAISNQLAWGVGAVTEKQLESVSQ